MVQIKSIEHKSQVIIIMDYGFVNTYRYKLIVVYLTITVSIDRIHQFFKIAHRHWLTLRYCQESVEFFDCDKAIAVKIDLLEDIADLLDLTVRHLSCNVGRHYFF